MRSPNLGWRDVPLKEILEARLNLPVYVENDANAAALSELWYGPIEVWSAHCVLFILVVEGVGTGLILNGELYVGSRIGMGGFGHISVDPDGPPCSCGSIGCWETIASDAATLKRYTETCPNARPAHTLQSLIDTVYAGDSCATEVLKKTASAIGRGIKGLAHGLAPEIIVIGGQITASWSIIEPVIANELKSEYFVPGISTPHVKPASVEQPSFFGAFPVALRKLLHKSKRGRAL